MKKTGWWRRKPCDNIHNLTIDLKKELIEKYKLEDRITLQGFTSSTLSREVAIQFAFEASHEQMRDSNLNHVLLEIEFKGD